MCNNVAINSYVLLRISQPKKKNDISSLLSLANPKFVPFMDEEQDDRMENDEWGDENGKRKKKKKKRGKKSLDQRGTFETDYQDADGGVPQSSRVQRNREDERENIARSLSFRF